MMNKIMKNTVVALTIASMSLSSASLSAFAAEGGQEVSVETSVSDEVINETPGETIVTPAESDSEEVTAVLVETPEDPSVVLEGAEEIPEEKAEENPETAPEEKTEENPETMPEENAEEAPETAPEENKEEGSEETPEETPEDPAQMAAEETDPSLSSLKVMAGIGDDWVNPSEDEIDKNNKTQEKEEKADKKKADKEKETESTINQAGSAAGKLVVKIATTDYSDPEKAVEDITLATIKLVNSTYVSKIPYVGGFMKEIIDAATGTKSAEQIETERYNKISKQLTEINKSINLCTDRLLAKTDATQINGKIKEINDTASALDKFYDNNNTKFQNAVQYMANGKAEYSMGTIMATLNGIYTADNKEFLNKYNEFVGQILNKNSFMPTYAAFGGNSDIFDMYNMVVTDGNRSIDEFNTNRRAMVSKVDDYCSTGYDVLHTTMTVYLENQTNIHNALVEKVEELDKAIAALDPDSETYSADLARLREQRKIFGDKELEYNNIVTETGKSLKNLETQNTELKDRLKNQLDTITKDEEAFKNRKRNDEIQVTEHKVSKEVINGKMGYPVLSEDKNTIIYEDIYGNKIGQRKVDYEFTRVEQYDVRAGKVYKVVKKIDCGLASYNQTYMVLAAKIKEEDGTFWGTNRIMYGTDIKTGKEIRFVLGLWGDSTCYEQQIGNMEKV